MKVKVAQSFLTLCDPMDCRDSPGQNTVICRLSLLQGIFPTQGWNPGLPHCRQILYHLSHRGSPILKRVGYPFSSGSYRHRNGTGISCIAGRFLTNWAISEEIRKSRKSSYLSSVHFWQSCESILMQKSSLFNEWCWDSLTSTCKRMNLDTYLTLYTKINSKWVIHLNVKSKILKIPEENMRGNLHYLG